MKKTIVNSLLIIITFLLLTTFLLTNPPYANAENFDSRVSADYRVIFRNDATATIIGNISTSRKPSGLIINISEDDIGPLNFYQYTCNPTNGIRTCFDKEYVFHKLDAVQSGNKVSVKLQDDITDSFGKDSYDVLFFYNSPSLAKKESAGKYSYTFKTPELNLDTKYTRIGVISEDKIWLTGDPNGGQSESQWIPYIDEALGELTKIDSSGGSENAMLRIARGFGGGGLVGKLSDDGLKAGTTMELSGEFADDINKLIEKPKSLSKNYKIITTLVVILLLCITFTIARLTRNKKAITVQGGYPRLVLMGFAWGFLYMATLFPLGLHPSSSSQGIESGNLLWNLNENYLNFQIIKYYLSIAIIVLFFALPSVILWARRGIVSGVIFIITSLISYQALMFFLLIGFGLLFSLIGI